MKKFLIACSILSLFSCVRAEKEANTSVTLNLPANFGKPVATSAKVSAKTVSPQSLNSSIVPGSLSEMNCFVVLVSGPEERMRDNVCEYKTTLEKFYVGQLAGGFYKAGASGARMSFDVPNGKDRGIYLVGFKIDTSASNTAGLTAEGVCNRFINDESMDTFVSQPYMIANSTGLTMTGEDLNIEMTATLNSSAVIGDCKGPDFPSNNNNPSSGIPARFGISFQDGVGTSSKPFSSYKCVGVRIQIQDANGNRANVSSTPSVNTFNAKVTMNHNGNPIGTFYHTGGGYGCAPGTEMSSGSSDMTIAFSNMGTVFSDFVAYFSPSDAQTPTGTMTVSDAGSTYLGVSHDMTAGTISYRYDNVTSTPQYYAIYDLYNNKSTGSATTLATRNVIKTNECRVGALQFLDVNGVPTRMSLSTGPYRTVDITPVGTTSNLRFYASSWDCSISSNDFSTATVSFTPYSNYGSYHFNYKMAIAMTQFSFSAVNGAATSTPVLVSGDMSSNSNFWSSEN